MHNLFFFLNLFILFIYLFLAVLGLRFVRGLSLVAASGGHSPSRCAGLSLSRPLPLRGTGSRRAGSAAVAHGPSRSAARWDPPRPGLEPVSPALAGRLSTTAPPGKPKDAQSSKQSYSIILKVKKHLPSGQIWFLVMYLTLKATFFSPPKSPLHFNIFASP